MSDEEKLEKVMIASYQAAWLHLLIESEDGGMKETIGRSQPELVVSD